MKELITAFAITLVPDSQVNDLEANQATQVPQDESLLQGILLNI